MAADPADRLVTDAFDVHLPDRVDLERGVDGDERVVTGQATHVVGDFDALDHAALVAPVVERVGSGEVGAPRRAEEQLAGVEVEDGVAHQS